MSNATKYVQTEPLSHKSMMGTITTAATRAESRADRATLLPSRFTISREALLVTASRLNELRGLIESMRGVGRVVTVDVDKKGRIVFATIDGGGDE